MKIETEPTESEMVINPHAITRADATKAASEGELCESQETEPQTMGNVGSVQELYHDPELSDMNKALDAWLSSIINPETRRAYRRHVKNFLRSITKLPAPKGAGVLN